MVYSVKLPISQVKNHVRLKIYFPQFNSKTMKITILSGSVRQERQSHRVAEHLQRQLTAKNIETDLIDLAETRLPVYGDPEIRDHSVAIRDIGQRLGKADAIILVTPEYHGSFSGVLKNALDYYWAEFARKPIAVAAASSGRMGGINASVQLQHVILSLGAYPLPLKLLVPEVPRAFDESGELVNERTQRSVQKFLDELLWFSGALVHHQKSGVAIT